MVARPNCSDEIPVTRRFPKELTHHLHMLHLTADAFSMNAFALVLFMSASFWISPFQIRDTIFIVLASGVPAVFWTGTSEKEV